MYFLFSVKFNVGNMARTKQTAHKSNGGKREGGQGVVATYGGLKRFKLAEVSSNTRPEKAKQPDNNNKGTGI